MDAIALIFIAYLLGSINFATLCCRFFKLGDPRQLGSGNPGASNVLRVAGTKAALIVLGCDACKGLIPVIIGHAMGLDGLLLGVVAMATVVGHCYPIWHRFKGGKGVATFIGAMLAIDPMVGGLACTIWALIALLTRYAALASLLSALFCPILLAKFSHFGYVPPTCVMVGIIVYRHWNNILRLKAKEEPKIKFSASGVSTNERNSKPSNTGDKQQPNSQPSEAQDTTKKASDDRLDTQDQDSQQHSNDSPDQHHNQND